MSDAAPSSAVRLAGRAFRFGVSLDRLETSPWVGIVVAVVLWGLVVIFAEPWGRLWGTGQDARCYYQATLADPYLHSSWNDPIAYVYSPAFLQLVSPLTALPWQAFMAVWTGLLIGAVRFLTGPRLLTAGLLFPFTAMEVAGGNVSLLLAVAIVVGFRWPAAWSLVLLTKITPGIGLLWFAVRREWRSLFIALGATALVAAVSAVVMPAAWRQWLDVIVANAGKGGTWASVPVPLLIRLPLAVALVVWGARTDRRWTVPVASMLALPALWYGGLSMLLAVIPLLPRQPAVGSVDNGDSSDAWGCQMRSRLILAATFVAGLLLVGVGGVLVVVAVGGYGEWDRGQRVLAAALGVFTTALVAGVLALFTRQQILGRPRVTISTIGLSVGSNTIPWAEIVSVGRVQIYGVRLLAIAQPRTAPQRVPRLDSVPFTHLAGLRVLFLSDRQLGEDVEMVLRRIRSIREPGAAEPVDDNANDDPWWRSH